MKREIAASKGITLVIIPCWWDRTKDRLVQCLSSLFLLDIGIHVCTNICSLVATIKKHRPELLSEITSTADPIPEDMPADFLESQIPTVEDIGHPVTACFFTLSKIDPTNWYSFACVSYVVCLCITRWVFEKYDGVRAFWNPNKKAFYSRRGNKFTSIPQEIIDSMPDDIFLDGELW